MVEEGSCRHLRQAGTGLKFWLGPPRFSGAECCNPLVALPMVSKLLYAAASRPYTS